MTRTAKAIAAAALTAATRCSPWVNASWATSSKVAPSRSGSRSATATAPPRVSRATAAAWSGIPAGTPSAIWAR